jgi:hypothetical protein
MGTGLPAVLGVTRDRMAGAQVCVHDHVQCVPKWQLALTFTQVTVIPPEVCKTVGFAYPGSNPGPATTGRNAPELGRRGYGLILLRAA